jgi:signal peptidase II
MQKVQDNGSSSKLEVHKTTDFVGEDKSKVSPGRYRGKLRLFLIVAALVVALDQLSKLWIRANLFQPDQIELVPGFLDLVHVENSGAIFGLLPSHTELLIAIGIAGAVIILVFLYYFPPVNNVGVVSFALILGGVVGNLIDRIRLNRVTDFISIHWLKLFYWPPFNIADAVVIVGIFILIYYFYKSGVFRKAYARKHSPQN